MYVLPRQAHCCRDCCQRARPSTPSDLLLIWNLVLGAWSGWCGWVGVGPRGCAAVSVSTQGGSTLPPTTTPRPQLHELLWSPSACMLFVSRSPIAGGCCCFVFVCAARCQLGRHHPPLPVATCSTPHTCSTHTPAVHHMHYSTAVHPPMLVATCAVHLPGVCVCVVHPHFAPVTQPSRTRSSHLYHVTLHPLWHGMAGRIQEVLVVERV
jgi:hypothetical protein